MPPPQDAFNPTGVDQGPVPPQYQMSSHPMAQKGFMQERAAPMGMFTPQAGTPQRMPMQTGNPFVPSQFQPKAPPAQFPANPFAKVFESKLDPALASDKKQDSAGPYSS